MCAELCNQCVLSSETSVWRVQGSPEHAARIEAGAAASTSGRGGVPTKVMSHRKGSKQLTNLAVVQELFAHTGTLVTHLMLESAYLPLSKLMCRPIQQCVQ